MKSSPIELDAVIQQALEAQGWAVSRTLSDRVYFEKPRLQLCILSINGRMLAYIDPRERAPGPDGHRIEPDKYVYRFRGRGAQAAARACAVDLISEHFGYLDAVGVRLMSVAVEVWQGSGRGGGYYEKSFDGRFMPEVQHLVEKG